LRPGVSPPAVVGWGQRSDLNVAVRDGRGHTFIGFCWRIPVVSLNTEADINADFRRG
jgi:hypothetical protein